MRSSARLDEMVDYVKFDRWEEAQRKFMMKHAAAEVWNGIQETFNRLIGMRWDRWTTVVHQQPAGGESGGGGPERDYGR